MKLKLENLQRGLDGMLARLNSTLWERLDGLVDVCTGDDAVVLSDDLGYDLDRELADPPTPEEEKLLRDLNERAGQLAEAAATQPARDLIDALRLSPMSEVTQLAGCDPLDPAEIRSAVKRAAKLLPDWVTEVTLAFPAGAQDSFYAALEQSVPPRIAGLRVHLRPALELLDKSVLEELFPEEPADDGSSVRPGPPEESPGYDVKVRAAAARSPWYVVAHAPNRSAKPFELLVRRAPRFVGPKLALEHASRLVLRPGRTVRVAPSRIVLAR